MLIFNKHLPSAITVLWPPDYRLTSKSMSEDCKSTNSWAALISTLGLSRGQESRSSLRPESVACWDCGRRQEQIQAMKWPVYLSLSMFEGPLRVWPTASCNNSKQRPTFIWSYTGRWLKMLFEILVPKRTFSWASEHFLCSPLLLPCGENSSLHRGEKFLVSNSLIAVPGGCQLISGGTA